MRQTRQFRGSLFGWLVCLAVAIAMSGCVTVKLVGDYDEQIDKGTTTLQKDVETFLIKLESTADAPGKQVEAYGNHRQFYADAKVAISGLRIRADATERDSLTVRMLDKLKNNLDRLERMHGNGLARREIDQSLRGGFTTQFTAILTFELAKKRGEKPDEAKAIAPATQAKASTGDSK